MSECHTECDCDLIDGKHDLECSSHRKCDWDGEGAYCDRHFDEAAEYNHRVLSSPIGQTEEEMRQDMIDAGRGHLLPDVMADRIDAARMREKDAWTKT